MQQRCMCGTMRIAQTQLASKVLQASQSWLAGKASRPSFVVTICTPQIIMLRLLFCTGGRGVIEGLGGQLGLSNRQVEPSFNSLYW